MRVERLSKSWLLRYERGSVLLIARNAYGIQEALLICRVTEVRSVDCNFTGLWRPPLLYLWAKSGMSDRSKPTPPVRMP